MAGHFAIGILLIASGVGITYFLKRFSFVQNDPLIYYTTLANPGLVGIFAGTAFLFSPFSPDMTKVLLYCAVGLIILTLPVIVFVLPKAWTDQVMEQARQDSKNNADKDEKQE